MLLAYSLTGCGGTPPRPEERLVGIWKVQDGEIVIEFSTDGTFKYHNTYLFTYLNGQWTIDSYNELNLIYVSIIPDSKYTINFKDDTKMTLMDSKMNIKYYEKIK
jgi:hypothetical protein